MPNAAASNTGLINRRTAVCAMLASVMVLITNGCVTNDLNRFYVDTTGGAPVPEEFKGIVPLAYFTADALDEGRRFKDEGYTLLGGSEYFTPRPPTIKDLQRQAKKVGATRVICQTSYKETVTQYRPVYNYIPGTTTTSDSSGIATATGTANVYGNGWNGYGTSQANGSYSSSATASSPGHLEYAGAIPYNVRLYDVAAAFFRRPATLPQ